MITTAIMAASMVGGGNAAGGCGASVETKKTVVFPEETIQLELYTNQTGKVFDGNQFQLVAGQMYEVSWNGTLCRCECKAYPELDAVGIGIDLITGEGYEETPFSIAYIEGQTMILAEIGLPAVTLSVSVEEEIIHPIDPKFLPSSSGGGLPVVDISGISYGPEPAKITDTALCAQLEAHLAAGTPALLVVSGVPGSGGYMAAISTVFEMEGLAGYMHRAITVGDAACGLLKKDGEWVSQLAE